MIKPCPLCNHKSYRLHTTITCSNCGLSIARKRIKKVIDDWNNRPREDELLKIALRIKSDLIVRRLCSGELLEEDERILKIIKKYEGENEQK